MSPREAQISREIQDFLKMLGFWVWSTEQGFRKERGGTRQTPGIPDLIVMGHGRHFYVEVKNEKGKLRESQKNFQECCEQNGVEYVVWRSPTDAFDWCVGVGLIEEC